MAIKNRIKVDDTTFLELLQKLSYEMFDTLEEYEKHYQRHRLDLFEESVQAFKGSIGEEYTSFDDFAIIGHFFNDFSGIDNLTEVNSLKDKIETILKYTDIDSLVKRILEYKENRYCIYNNNIFDRLYFNDSLKG